MKNKTFFALTFLFSLFVMGAYLAGQQTNEIPFERPNIVLINLDDADAELLRPAMLQSFYPNIRQMAQQGVRFSNLHATTPFCAPSRACLFRGQYAFNTGVKVNEPESLISNGFPGSYLEFKSRGYHEDELGVWLKNAGYRTMHVGKYHHHDFDYEVPPGWDDFRVALGARYMGNFRFTNKETPDGQFAATSQDEYVTTVDANDAVELIEQQAGRQQPFFLYVAPIAPHTPNTFVPEDMVEPRYRQFAQNHSMPYSPDLYEDDLSDKPKHLRRTVGASRIDSNRRFYISRVRAMKSIDDMVGRIYDALASIDQADNTYVLLTSDNGYQLGHHHLHSKIDPYHRTTNVPLLITGPAIPFNRSYSHLLAHIDICPTILDLAGAPIPNSVDAKSFRPLLFNAQNFSEESWQDGIMIENWSKKNNTGGPVVGTYAAYRRHHEIFVSWANGEFEYYDLNTDPYQLNNRYSELPTSDKQNWKRIVRRFRKRRIEPITTLDQIYRARIQNRNVKLRGYAEDDAGVFGTLVTMKSTTTQRFWNGEQWQDQWYGHFVDAKNRNQPVSIWNFNTRVETETASGLDYIVFTYRSLDSDGVLPHFVNFHVNTIDGKSPVANFLAYGNRPVFNRNSFNLEGTYFDAVEFDKVLLSIRRVDTNQYFNGTTFQSRRVDFPAELTGESRWCFNIPLPAGTYVAAVRGVDAAGNK
ncbi:MAG: sulfatase, partial [Planctomycetota bacterium]